MANINQQWKRFLAVSCSHGNLQDDQAIEDVLNFKDRYKPDKTIHLGDYTEMTAFMGGARGTKAEAVNPTTDLETAISFLTRLKPDVLINGNHDIRLWENLNHHHAVVAFAAAAAVREIEKFVSESGCYFVRDYDISKSWYKFADVLACHGWMYSEQAIKEHAEHFAGRAKKIIFGHLHTTGMATARVSGGAKAYCAGFLGDRGKDGFNYAKRRRAFEKWNKGLVIGEYTENDSAIWLIEEDASGRLRFPL